jgi:hypothetical protein
MEALRLILDAFHYNTDRSLLGLQARYLLPALTALNGTVLPNPVP